MLSNALVCCWSDLIQQFGDPILCGSWSTCPVYNTGGVIKALVILDDDDQLLFVLQAADMYGNLLLLTLPVQVNVIIVGDGYLPICSSLETDNCFALRAVGSELLVSFIPIISVPHRISVMIWIYVLSQECFLRFLPGINQQCGDGKERSYCWQAAIRGQSFPVVFVLRIHSQQYIRNCRTEVQRCLAWTR